MYKYVLLFVVFIESVSAFNLNNAIAQNTAISRRGLLKLIPTLTLFAPAVPTLSASPEEENKPLTPEEMEEYNRLLEEAKRIQSIIDANIKASDEEFARRLKELKQK